LYGNYPAATSVTLLFGGAPETSTGLDNTITTSPAILVAAKQESWGSINSHFYIYNGAVNDANMVWMIFNGNVTAGAPANQGGQFPPGGIYCPDGIRTRRTLASTGGNFNIWRNIAYVLV